MFEHTMNDQHNVAILTLDNGITNAITPELVNNLSESLSRIKTNAIGLIICGRERFFSIGLDLPYLLDLNRSDMSHFWHQFNGLILDLYSLPIPTVCAISGHAVAGGKILSLTCDYRFATSEVRKIGLNEIKLGVPVPYLADLLLKQIVGERLALHLLYGGDLINLSEAKSIGLVDEIHSKEQLKQAAIEKAGMLGNGGMRAFTHMKCTRAEEILCKYNKNSGAKNKLFLDLWFDKKIQKRLKAASEKF